MIHTWELKDREVQPALVVRRRAPVQQLPRVVGEAWGAVMAHASRLGVTPVGPPFVAYHNMDMADLDLEIGLPFPETLSGEGEVREGHTPGGRAAECLYVGPYDQIGEAYDALQPWLDEHGHTPTGIAYEFYLNDPETTPPEELQTRVVFPLR
jgi:effector-binding domain-containing protein